MGDTGDLPPKAGTLSGVIALTILAAVSLPEDALSAGRSCPPPSEIAVSDFSRGFVQTRHLKGVSAPLVSKGTVSLDGEIIEWHNRSPVDILTTFGPDGITQSVESGDPEPVAAGGGAVPGLGGLPLANVLRGDLSKLDAYFLISTSAAVENGPWVTVLQPRDSGLADILGTIEIRGCTEVETVTLRRATGDYDVIQLVPQGS